jgi:hypothetical protein
MSIAVVSCIDPDVAVTVKVTAVVPPPPPPWDLPPHAETKPRPATLIASNKSNCRRLRFLKPTKQSTTASVAAGKYCRDPRSTAALLEPFETVIVVVWAVAPEIVTFAGENVQTAPVGWLLQAKETVPVIPFAGVTVKVLVPLAPFATVIVEGAAESAKLAGESGGAALTVKLCATGGAGAYVPFPAWLASMVHVPAETRVTAVPETVQTPVVAEVKVTASPEVAVATSAGTAVPMVCVPGLAKVMVCASPLTVKLCATCGAGA